MTVATTVSKVNHSGDGVTTIFTFTFKVIDVADMFVYINDEQVTSGFTVNLNVDQDASPGGNVTFDTAPVADSVVTLLRFLLNVQLTDYQPYDPFPAETHELALDKLTMMIQQLQEQTARTVIFPPSHDPATGTDTSMPQYNPGKTLCWDTQEARLVNCDPCECPEPEERWMHIFGKINGADGATLKGSGGFGSSRDSEGAYTITFGAAINVDYVVTASLSDGAAGFGSGINVSAESANAFTAQIRDAESGVFQDRSWSFHLIYEAQGYKSLTLLNPSFETGDFTNWNIDSGTPNIVENADSGTVQPHEGSYFVGSGVVDSGAWVISSDNVDLLAGGIDGADIDNGLVTAEVRWQQSSSNPGTNNDEGRAGLRFFASDGTTPVGSDSWGSYNIFKPWQARSHNIKIPATARYVRVLANSKMDVGTFPSAYFDNFSLWWRK